MILGASPTLGHITFVRVIEGLLEEVGDSVELGVKDGILVTAGGTLHFGPRKISLEPSPDKMVQIIFDTGILRLLDITIVHVAVVDDDDDDDDDESK